MCAPVPSRCQTPMIMMCAHTIGCHREDRDNHRMRQTQRTQKIIISVVLAALLLGVLAGTMSAVLA